ncbi:hypothetical protein E3N88_13753 [Mikania micrantha]|uniref:Uncharacterized protein n=1 Tax=Mikania micrantha TaxID=192012 RepID=A0A5N6P1I4_9ASTR|nr:hypothetical protein E3N88_13753 [Mikania micrantha]
MLRDPTTENVMEDEEDKWLHRSTSITTITGLKTDAEERSQLAQKMESWKMALTEIADIKGRDAKDRKETEFIQEVVAHIHHRLPSGNTLPPLIGMDHEIWSIRSWLTDGSSNTVDILTVVGVGGIGKTSLAKYVFHLHSNKFQKSSFIEGINETCKKNLNGMLDLQKQLFGDISKNLQLQIHDVSVYASKIKNALAHKKVLLVLDDVGCLDQLDALLGNEPFHQGSKIIITTKDASLTERCALFDLPVQPKHEKISLKGLYKSASLELLCIHAFKSNKPEKGYEEASEKLVEYCQGHPLALKVLGRSLQKRDVAYWEECIKVLKKEPHSQVNNALKMSFDALLSKNDKELFKHIACFFVRIDRDVAETILNSCDINARYGITNLIERCLLSIDRHNALEMHSLIQEMGRDLVRQESPDRPWKRSRLWCHEESFKVLEQKQGTGNLVGLALDMRMLEKEKLSGCLQLKTDALSKMDKLKLLLLNYVKINGSYENVPKELRWLCMHGFHLKSIPSKLPLEKVVVLDMSYSKIESFDMSYSRYQQFVSRLKGLIGLRSKDKRLLGSLKILDLSFCELLHSVGGFYLLPALERLILKNCTSLIEVCESIEQCDELVHIDLSYCCKLKKLPKSLCKLNKVQTLLLDGCISLETQIQTGNVNVIPSDSKFFLISLPRSLRTLSLANNNLSNECFPMDLSCLAMLKELRLDGNPIVSMPDCVRTLPRLEMLGMKNCDKLILIEHPPCTLNELKVDFYFNVEDNHSIRKMKFDPEMPPSLDISAKITEQTILYDSSWSGIKYIVEIVLNTLKLGGRPIECETQMFNEDVIFSTIYKGREMPEWIRHRSKDYIMTLTVPSSPTKLRGLIFSCIIMEGKSSEIHFDIKIQNITKNHSWHYKYYSDTDAIKNCEGGEDCLCFVSRWMFGPNEMKAGDTITVTTIFTVILECGIGFVYDDDGMDEGQDVLGY